MQMYSTAFSEVTREHPLLLSAIGMISSLMAFSLKSGIPVQKE